MHQVTGSNGQTYYDYITDFSPCQKTTRVVSILATTGTGALIGGAAGGVTGAVIGSSCAGIGSLPGAGIGASVGAVTGGAAGLIAGTVAINAWDYTHFRKWANSFVDERDLIIQNEGNVSTTPNGISSCSSRETSTTLTRAIKPTAETTQKNEKRLLSKLTSLIEEDRDFICPLTLCIPLHPVKMLHNESQVYEKEDLEKWVRANKSCPKTRLHVELSDIKCSMIGLVRLKNLCIDVLGDNYDKEKETFTERDLNGIRKILKGCSRTIIKISKNEQLALIKKIQRQEFSCQEAATRFQAFADMVEPPKEESEE